MSPRRRPLGAAPPTARVEPIAAATDAQTGFRLVAARHPPGFSWILDSHGETTLLIVVAGALREETAEGTVLLPRTTIAIRPPAAASSTFTAGPHGAQVVAIELTASILREYRPADRLLLQRQTFRGRSSVELAWRIAGELAGPDPLTPSALRVLVGGIIVGTTRYFLHRRESTATSPLAERARRILEGSLADPPTLATLAKRVGCSVEHLARTFRESYGFSTRAWIERRRVERGKQLLAEGSVPVAEIAEALGFCDASHFARAFRRATTTSPARFRAQHSQIKPVLSGSGQSRRVGGTTVRSLDG